MILPANRGRLRDVPYAPGDVYKCRRTDGSDVAVLVLRDSTLSVRFLDLEMGLPIQVSCWNFPVLERIA